MTPAFLRAYHRARLAAHRPRARYRNPADVVALLEGLRADAATPLLTPD